jgi:hypothetical protein
MMGTKNRISMFRIEIRDSLNFLWIFYSIFRCYRCSGRYLLLLQLLNLSLGIISFKDQVVDLFLEELNDCVALSDYMITLVDLIFSMEDGLIPCCDDLILLSYQGLSSTI